MGKSLQDLGLTNEPLPTTDTAAMPEFGRFAPPPPMGTYRFQMPDLAALRGPIYDSFDAKEGDDPTPKKRIRVEFDGDAPLLIVQSSNGTPAGTPFETRISNNKRMRGKKGSGILASDWDYLLKALGHQGATPTTNAAYIAETQKHAGKTFSADITYRWVCGTERDIYVDDGQGGVVKVEGKHGCGAKYYPAEQTRKVEQQIQKDAATGQYPYQIECSNPECRNVIRAFSSLDNFRA